MIEHNRRQAALIAPKMTRETVWGGGRQGEIERRTHLTVLIPSEVSDRLSELSGIEVIFSTWGMHAPAPEALDAMPRLRAVFYAAGSPQAFARPFLERGVTVVSAWRANAIPVAEFTLAQTLLSLKGYFRNVREFQSAASVPEGYRTAHRDAGAYGKTIALLGAGAIGRRVIELLRLFDVQVVVFDPFLSEADALALGVEQVSLADAFRRGAVVSNHLANNPETVGLINEPLLASLQPGATFINTGRGLTVREGDLAQVLAARPDLTALLDVTDPEPVSADSPLRTLPNVQISTHIAGAVASETWRMADLCIAEFDRWERGEPLQHAVTEEMLKTMAYA